MSPPDPHRNRRYGERSLELVVVNDPEAIRRAFPGSEWLDDGPVDLQLAPSPRTIYSFGCLDAGERGRRDRTAAPAARAPARSRLLVPAAAPP